MAETKRNGKIITFYSYKGGTGRSMALANVAWILASQGKRVLTLDWDLEAPGLHRYFYPFLLDKTLTSSDGIIDFVHKFTSAATISDSRKKQEETARTDDEWYKPYSNILRYATSLKWDFKDKGSLDFIPAGRQGPSYPTRINSFNWDHFYNKLGGGLLLELAKERMRAEYDYILIDSRTGVSDTAGICTIQMPDILVICFTLNNQSIEGASDVANDVFEKRLNAAKAQAESKPDELPKPEEVIQIFPVPMRAENAEKVKLQTRKNYAREKFKLFPNSLPGEERERYWGYVPVTYIPYYAYEEILSVFGDNPADRVSILAAAEELSSYITGGEIQKLAPPTEAERKKVLEEFEGRLAKGSPADEENRFAESFFERLGQEEQESVRQLMVRLVRAAQPEEVGGDTLLRVNVNDLEESALKVLRPLVNVSLVQKELDSATGKEVVKVASDTLIKNWLRLQGWINEDREFLLWRQKLQLKISDWQKGRREIEALLSGTPLEEARDWLEKRRKDLNDAEVSYIELSIADAERRLKEQEMAQRRLQEERQRREQELEQQRLNVQRLINDQETASEQLKSLTQYRIEVQRRQRRVYLSAVAILLIAALSFFAYRFFGSSSTEKKDKSLQLAAFSTVAEDPELSVLLAIAAARVEQTTEAGDALRASLQNFRQTAILRGHNGTVFSAVFSSDGKLILTASSDQTAIIWSQEGSAWRNSRTLRPSIGYVQSAAFSPDSKFAALGGYEKDVKVFDVTTGEEVETLPAAASVLDVAFSPDGKYLLTATSGNEANIWDWQAGNKKYIASLAGHVDDANSAVYSPDAKLILTASSDMTVRIWDAASRQRIGELRGHTGKVYNAEFSPDGRSIVTASEDGTARIWDTATMKETKMLNGHTGDVWDAAFSPDGSLIVTAGADRTARVWDAKTGETKLVLRGHLAAINSAAFSRDGRSVVTASSDKTVRLWDVSGDYSVGNSVDELITQGCNKLSRNMSLEEWQRYMAGEPYRKTCENLP